MAHTKTIDPCLSCGEDMGDYIWDITGEGDFRCEDCYFEELRELVQKMTPEEREHLYGI